MKSILEDLLRHKAWANSALLDAIQNHPAATQDEELRKMLHHILVANRFWIFTILDCPFDRDSEMHLPANLADLAARFRETEHLEARLISTIAETDLDRVLPTRTSLLGIDVTVRHAILQICLHTQGHRAQCASRLRALGATPPGTDYVLWIKDQVSH